MLRGSEGLAVGTGESEKTARCDSTTAAANGQSRSHARLNGCCGLLRQTRAGPTLAAALEQATAGHWWFVLLF